MIKQIHPTDEDSELAQVSLELGAHVKTSFSQDACPRLNAPEAGSREAGGGGGTHTHPLLSGDFQRLTLLLLNPMHLKETAPSKEETVAGQ